MLYGRNSGERYPLGLLIAYNIGFLYETEEADAIMSKDAIVSEERGNIFLLFVVWEKITTSEGRFIP